MLYCPHKAHAQQQQCCLRLPVSRCLLPEISAQGADAADRCAAQTISAEQIERWGQELIEVEVTPDHVHLLVGCDPQFGIHRLVKLLKSFPHTLREEYPGLKRRLPSLWTNSYLVATTGGVTLETLKRYVQGQKGQ